MPYVVGSELVLFELGFVFDGYGWFLSLFS